MYGYFGFMTETEKILENPKMSLNRQSNMLFGKIISYTCDLHLKLNILNPLKLLFLSNDLKNESFALEPFPWKFSSSSFNEHVLL
jgi:hypothetical protein